MGQPRSMGTWVHWAWGSKRFQNHPGFPLRPPQAGLWPYLRPVDKSPGVKETLFPDGDSGSPTHPSVEAVTRATLFASGFWRVTPELAILTHLHARVQPPSSSPALCIVWGWVELCGGAGEAGRIKGREGGLAGPASPDCQPRLPGLVSQGPGAKGAAEAVSAP